LLCSASRTDFSVFIRLVIKKPLTVSNEAHMMNESLALIVKFM